MAGPLFLILVPLGTSVVLLVAGHGRTQGSRVRWASVALFVTTLVIVTVVPALRIVPLVGRGGSQTFLWAEGSLFELHLRMAGTEAVILSLLHLVTLLAVVFRWSDLRTRSIAKLGMVMAVMVGVNGLVLTVNLANATAFLAIISAGTFGLLSHDLLKAAPENVRSFIIAACIPLGLLAAGTAIVYGLSGATGIAAALVLVQASSSAAMIVVPSLLFAALVLELRLFPANRSAVRLLARADSIDATLLATISATACIVFTEKLLPLFPRPLIVALIWVGLATYLLLSLAEFSERNPTRVLAFNTPAQIGLVAALIGLVNLDGRSRLLLILAGGGLLINHLISKAGLLWIAREPEGRARTTMGRVGAVVLGLALVGLPPFPGFWAKWQLINAALASGRTGMLAAILAGSVLEAIAMVRWIGTMTRPEAEVRAHPKRVHHPLSAATLVSMTTMLGALGVFAGWTLGLNDRVIWAPLFFALGVLAVEWLPSRPKGVIAAIAVVAFAWISYPLVSGLAMIFGALATAGTLIAIGLAAGRGETPAGLLSAMVLTGTSLTGLVTASEPIAFCMLWLFVTIGIYLVNLKSGPAVTRTFAVLMVGGLLIMTGLLLGSQEWTLASGAPIAEVAGADGYVRLPVVRSGVSDATGPSARTGGLALAAGLGAWSEGIPLRSSVAITILLGVGFLATLASAGVNGWLPTAYREARPETTILLSFAHSIAGTFGLVLLVVMFGGPTFTGRTAVFAAVGWIGAVTFLLGAVRASIEHEPRRILAYSSMSQLGLATLIFSITTPLGTIAGVYHTAIHLLAHTLMIVAVAGVRDASRLATKNDGLRPLLGTPMRLAALIIGALLVAGVPPFAGFGSKWLVFASFAASGLTVHGVIAVLGHVLTVLYTIRLIILLSSNRGTLTDAASARSRLPEAVAAGVLALVAMLVSLFPSTPLAWVVNGTQPFVVAVPDWIGTPALAPLAAWMDNATVYATGGMIVLVSAWVVVGRRRERTVAMPEIDAGKRPNRENRLVSRLRSYMSGSPGRAQDQMPIADRFWNGVSSALVLAGRFVGRLYGEDGSGEGS